MGSKVAGFKESWRKIKTVAEGRGWTVDMRIISKYPWDVKVAMMKVVDGERLGMALTVDKGEGAEIIRAARRHVNDIDIDEALWTWGKMRGHAAGTPRLQENVIVIIERFIEEASALVTDLETLFEKEE